MPPEPELATLVRILTGPRSDSERRDVRRIEKFIKEIVKRELKENA